MRRGNLALLAILIVGGIARIMVPQSSSSPNSLEAGSARIAPATSAQNSPAKKPNPRESTEWYPTELRKKIRDFYGRETGPEVDLGGPPCPSSAHWCVPTGRENNIRFLVATVPDPVHSRLGFFFDRSIDAIQQGATSYGYLFDRAIMPWTYFDVTTNQETNEQTVIRKNRESYPGLMIFRSDDKPTLMVLVVGETPTAGINKEQFHHAVQIIHEIRRGKDTASSTEMLDFGILGPTFSGSLYSLQQILLSEPSYYPDSKSSRGNVGVLPVYSNVMATTSIQAFLRGKPAWVEFGTFEQDSQTAFNALSKYVVKDLGYEQSDIALLNEDGTAYGSAFGLGILNLSFPRGISQFRSAYSKAMQQADSNGTNSNQNQRRNLPSNLEATGSDDDNIAPYAKMQTALNQEAIMLGLVSEFKRHGTRFILLRATDPLDELFLASYLSQEYPQARLVVPSPDLLFSRDESGYLDGVLQLNTYPLLPLRMNQTCPGTVVIPPAAASWALFNAIYSLLERMEILPPAAGTSPQNSSKNQDLIPCRLSPDLWLTIVTRNTVRPIRVFRPDTVSQAFANSNYHGWDENDQRDSKIPSAWVFAYALCLVLLGRHLWRSRNGEKQGQWLTARRPPMQRQAWLLWAGSLVLFAIALTLALAGTPPVRSRGPVLAILLSFLVWLPLIFFVWMETWDLAVRRKELVVGISFLVVSLVIAAGGFAYVFGTVYDKSSGMVLWQQRALDLSTGVTPTTPLLALLSALYFWFWYRFKSEALIDWRSPKLPQADKLSGSFRNLSESAAACVRDTIASFREPLWVPVFALLVVAAFALPSIAIGPGHIPLRSLDGRIFDAVYCTLFALALLVLIAMLLKAIATWLALRPLLAALDRPGLRDALQRLSGFEWEVIWNPFHSMREQASKLLRREVQVVDRLRESFDCALEETDPKIEQLKSDFKTIAESCQEIGQATPATSGSPSVSVDINQLTKPYEKLQTEFADLAGYLCTTFLDESWKNLPADDGATGSVVTSTPLEPDPYDPSGLSKHSLELAEELVACVYANFITTVLLRIRWLVFTSAAVYTAIVLSSISYPFQPARSLSTLALILFIAETVIVGYVYEEMHRDVALQKMTSTDPNKIDTAFWVKFMTAGALPLLGLLTALFPQVGHFLYTIVAPILKASQ